MTDWHEAQTLGLVCKERISWRSLCSICVSESVWIVCCCIVGVFGRFSTYCEASESVGIDRRRRERIVPIVAVESRKQDEIGWSNWSVRVVKRH